MELFQQIILGIIQGIVEWLPVSSEGFLLLVKSNFFNEINIDLFLRQALFLHLGTFFAALIYFRKEVIQLIKGTINYNHTDIETKKTVRFLVITTLITAVMGFAILKFLGVINIQKLPLTSASINLFIGFLLIITGVLQVKTSSKGYKREFDLTDKDSIFLGIAQGFATLPGLSRSGLTISSFLFKKFGETASLRLSFIMSLPIVFLANLVLNFRDFVFLKSMFFGFIFAFIFGLLTIHLLMKLSEKIKFGNFVIFFGILVILAGILELF